MHDCPNCGRGCDCDGDDFYRTNYPRCLCECSGAVAYPPPEQYDRNDTPQELPTLPTVIADAAARHCRAITAAKHLIGAAAFSATVGSTPAQPRGTARIWMDWLNKLRVIETAAEVWQELTSTQSREDALRVIELSEAVVAKVLKMKTDVTAQATEIATDTVAVMVLAVTAAERIAQKITTRDLTPLAQARTRDEVAATIVARAT